jgi:hypothetical protein
LKKFWKKNFQIWLTLFVNHRLKSYIEVPASDSA